MARRFVAPALVATAICGFTFGLEPPTAGNSMTSGAAIQIEPWAEASSDRIDLDEYFLRAPQKILLAFTEAGQRAAGTWPSPRTPRSTALVLQVHHGMADRNSVH